MGNTGVSRKISSKMNSIFLGVENLIHDFSLLKKKKKKKLTGVRVEESRAPKQQCALK